MTMPEISTFSDNCWSSHTRVTTIREQEGYGMARNEIPWDGRGGAQDNFLLLDLRNRHPERGFLE